MAAEQGDGGRLPIPGWEDWPAQAADRLEQAVELVRERAVRPATAAARFVVFGFFAAIVALVLVLLLTVGLVRVLDAYVFPGRIWATYSLLGGIFVVAAGLVWSQRRPRKGAGS